MRKNKAELTDDQFNNVLSPAITYNYFHHILKLLK